MLQSTVGCKRHPRSGVVPFLSAGADGRVESGLWCRGCSAKYTTERWGTGRPGYFARWRFLLWLEARNMEERALSRQELLEHANECEFVKEFVQLGGR